MYRAYRRRAIRVEKERERWRMGKERGRNREGTETGTREVRRPEAVRRLTQLASGLICPTCLTWHSFASVSNGHLDNIGAKREGEEAFCQRVVRRGLKAGRTSGGRAFKSTLFSRGFPSLLLSLLRKDFNMKPERLEIGSIAGGQRLSVEGNGAGG